MNRTRRMLAFAALGALLFAGAAACGTSGSDDAADGTTTTAAPADTSDTTGASDSTTSSVADEGSSSGEQDCAATADATTYSGDSVVLFATDQDEQKESEIAADDTVTISADGTSMDPDPMEVEAGKMFGVKVDGYDVIDAVKIGCAGSQTMVPGATIGFIITEPGTYPLSLEIAGTELGTVVVS